MDTLTITITIMTMGIMIALGAFVASRVPVTLQAKELLMFIIINLAVPSIILNAVFNTEIDENVFQQVIIVFVVSVVFNGLGILITILIGRLIKFEPSLATKLGLLAVLGNVGFIGIPLSATIFGPIGGLLAAVFDAGIDLVLFSLGIYLLQSEKRFHFKQLKALINVPLIAIILGLAFVISNLEAPFVFKQLSSILSGLAAPLAMLYIGFLLYPFLRKEQPFYYKELWYPLILKLLLFPILAIFIMTLLPLEDFMKQLLTILIAMPTFMLASVVFSRYSDGDNLAVITTVVSTLLSLITIPLVTLIASIFI
ncbi:AEC family transporter [Alkalihalobacillus sp. 1P02AB]|uniref:AEC family transporter n=1 Tax=Alkalihalobacillus sp. 1P02AB TaxID=3132260 RepID=UPI0039A5EE4A